GEAPVDGAFTFQYSPRPGTLAVGMEPVGPDVLAHRYRRLTTLIEDLAGRASASRVGLIEDVLVEGPSKSNADFVSGRTPHNRLVHFRGQAGAGDFVPVRIDGSTPHYLTGEQVACPR